MYPNRVAVNPLTREVIVTERSPTHQVQIYDQLGNFVRKFGSNILQHPRGVCVDRAGASRVAEQSCSNKLVACVSVSVLPI